LKAVVTPKRHMNSEISCQTKPESVSEKSRKMTAASTVIACEKASANLEEGIKRARTTLKRQAANSPAYWANDN
jgi:hypothetical protein